MDEQLSEPARRCKLILEMLPKDPVDASAEILTHAAVVCIAAGFDDAAAVGALLTTLRELRARGLGEERH
jgi:hypothetical protein